MTNIPKETLATPDWLTLKEQSKVLEKDRRGVKVLQLQNGDILKIFRIRKKLSSAALSPYCHRFCKNAFKLKKLDVPTLSPLKRFTLPAKSTTAVLYKPLIGETLRQYCDEKGMDIETAQKLGKFLAELHQKGIYFRSIHFANIIVTPDEQFGLIDIADLKTYRKPLSLFRRLRNFKHLFRYEKDKKSIKEKSLNAFKKTYLKTAHLNSLNEKMISMMIDKRHKL